MGIEASSNSRMLDEVVYDMQSKGWSHVTTDIDPLDTARVRTLFSEMGTRLTINQSINPEISVIAPKDDSKTLAGSAQEMSFHTDNVYLDDPCKSVALFCALQAAEGGVNELIDGLEVVNLLPDDVKEGLADSRWHWSHPVTQESSGYYPVIGPNYDNIRWWRMSLLNKDLGSIAIADTLEDALNSTPGSQSILMKSGDILVTDNTRILHNRSAFIGARRVYRTRFW